MLRFIKKPIVYVLLVSMLAAGFTGCKKSGDAAADAETDGKVEDSEALDNAIADVIDPNATDAQNTDAADTGNPDITRVQNPDAGATSDIQTASEPQQAIAERSPVEITRADMGRPQGSSETTDKHKHKKTPNLFEVTECQVEIDGLYLVDMSKDLLKEINSRRKDYGIDQLTMGTSLLACADSRCKEQTYFVGHFRPDGSAFSTVSPDGYVQGEIIAVDFRDVNDIMESFFSVNKSRIEMMNPDYTQCGISIYLIDDTKFCAVEFAY